MRSDEVVVSAGNEQRRDKSTISVGDRAQVSNVEPRRLHHASPDHAQHHFHYKPRNGQSLGTTHKTAGKDASLKGDKAFGHYRDLKKTV